MTCCTCLVRQWLGRLSSKRIPKIFKSNAWHVCGRISHFVGTCVLDLFVCVCFVFLNKHRCICYVAIPTIVPMTFWKSYAGIRHDRQHSTTWTLVTNSRCVTNYSQSATQNGQNCSRTRQTTMRMQPRRQRRQCPLGAMRMRNATLILTRSAINMKRKTCTNNV